MRKLLEMLDVKRTDYCPCATGKKYKQCCFKEGAEVTKPWVYEKYLKDIDNMPFNHLRVVHLFKILEKAGGRIPRMRDIECFECSKPVGSTESHLIAKNILKQNYNGDKCKMAFSHDRFSLDFQDIALSKAGKVPTWCSTCDNLLFEEIDDHLDLSNEDHLFLLYYKIYAMYLRDIELELKLYYSLYCYYPSRASDPEFISLYKKKLNAATKNRIKLKKIDVLRKKGKSWHIKFSRFFVQTSEKIHVASLLPIFLDGKHPLLVYATPHSNKLEIVFTCLHTDYRSYSPYFKRLKKIEKSDTTEFKQAINDAIFNASNVYLDTSFSLPKESKKEIIEEYLHRYDDARLPGDDLPKSPIDFLR